MINKSTKLIFITKFFNYLNISINILLLSVISNTLFAKNVMLLSDIISESSFKSTDGIAFFNFYADDFSYGGELKVNDPETSKNILLQFNNKNETCLGTIDGSIEVIVNGGTQPYLYLWSTGDTTSTIDNLSSDTYYVTVTDSTGQIKTDSLLLLANPNYSIIIDTAILKGDSIYFNGKYINKSGEYTDTLQTVNGCDSIISMKLSVLEPAFICGDSVLYEGQKYSTVLIGNQCWFGENLNIGTKVDAALQADNSIIEKYCYDNLESNCDIYGGLYNWDEMMQYLPEDTVNADSNQGICPDGWHLSSDDEWIKLINYVGSANSAGAKLKEKDTLHWASPNVGATNEFGFTALPGGNSTGSLFLKLTYGAAYWTSDESSTASNSWIYGLGNDYEFISKSTWPKTTGASVRCVKNKGLGLNIIFDRENETCQGDKDGSIEALVTGGIGPFSYLWSTGDTVSSITELGAGIYTLTVTDIFDSIKVNSVEISTTPLPIAKINGSSYDTTWICEGDNISLLAEGGTDYAWSTGSTNALINLIIDSSGKYTVTVTENGCSSESNHYVSMIESPLISEISGDTIICGGTSYNYSVEKDTTLSYYWWIEGPDTNKPSITPTDNTLKLVLNSSPWSGHLFVQSFNGCYSDTAKLHVSIVTVPVIITNGDEIICKGDSVVLTASCTETLVWSTGDTASSITVAPEFSTPYYVTASNVNYTVTENINVFVYQIPKPPLVNNKIIRENDTIPEFEAIGDNVTWYADKELSAVLLTGNNYQPTDSAVGEYKYYVTQSNKYCKSEPAISTFVILENNYPPIIKDSVYYITENNKIGAMVGSIKSSDEDIDQELSHSILEISPSVDFDITALAGDIYIMEKLNYEQYTLFDLKVKVQDNSKEMASDTADIQIIVLNRNEHPAFYGNQLFRINGVLSAGDYIGTLTANDPDGDNILYYLYDNSVDDLFAVIDTTGDIVCAADTVLPRTYQYAFLVKAQDDATESLWTQSLVTVIIDSSTMEPPVEETVSINQIINTDKIRIYPNPAQDVLFIELSESFDEGRLELIAFNGQLIYTKDILKLGENPLKISLYELEIGLYFIRILVKEEIYQFKFIKE